MECAFRFWVGHEDTRFTVTRLGPVLVIEWDDKPRVPRGGPRNATIKMEGWKPGAKSGAQDEATREGTRGR